MKDGASKVLGRNPLPKTAAERPSPGLVLNAGAAVSDTSKEWKKYCDGRLRHFATGR